MEARFGRLVGAGLQEGTELCRLLAELLECEQLRLGWSNHFDRLSRFPHEKLHIGIVDIVSRGPTRALYARVMNPNLASIMPQVIGVSCREERHDVTFVCYTGFEDLLNK